MFTFEDYQHECERTANNKLAPDMQLAVAAMGLAGEAGEVVDCLKKHLGHDHPLDRAKVEKELGDVLWYAARLASILQLSLGDVALANLAKLQARYPEGFTPQRSQQRDEDLEDTVRSVSRRAAP